MEDLPPLTSSRNSSRAPSRPSSTPELTESHLYIRDFVRETRQRLNFSLIQLPIVNDQQLGEPSDCEMILVPLSCSALNALASMTRHLDTITTQLGTIQSIVATLTTNSALDSKLAPINASLRDLSQRMSAAPPSQVLVHTRQQVPPSGATTRLAPAPTQPPFPPTSATTRPIPLPAQPRAKTRAPPLTKLPLPLSTLTFPGTTRTPEPFTATLELTRTSSGTPDKQTRSGEGCTLIPPLSSLAT